MVDIFGNDTASNVDELHTSKLDDNINNTHMMDKLGTKIKEVDETSYDTILGGKIWDSVTSIPSFPLVYAGSKIWDLGTKILRNDETPEERDNGKERNVHTFQDSSGDGSSWERDYETGRSIHTFKSGNYDVFEPGKCVMSYDKTGKFLGSTC